MTKHQQSSIDRLPDDIREKLFELLRDPRVTQLDATAKINDILETEGHPERVSKSAVNRCAVRMQKIGETLRQSRETAQMLIGNDAFQAQGETGKLLANIVQTLAFNTGTALLEEGGAVDPKMLRAMATSVYRLEKTLSESLRREKEIKERTIKDAADTAVKTAKQAGVSQETIDIIRRDVLRISE